MVTEILRGPAAGFARCAIPRVSGWFFAAGILMSCVRAEGVDFSRDVLPVLVAHCFECHGPDAGQRKAKLRLDVRENAVENRKGHTAIAIGSPEQSEMIRRILSADPEERMPPPGKGPPLAPAEIQRLRDWIAEGAGYRQHWAFERPQRRDLPPVRMRGWVQTPVDRWILQRLENSGLQPAAPASKTTLIRRLTLDLIGLPPTPAEIDAFLADASPLAYDRVVDRLLNSPQYGERWGRHWLDVARYADSGGFETDLFFGHAWRYRDYVIRALNADKPFDRFIREQIAGDELFAGDAEAQEATGFYTTGPVLQEAGMVTGKLEYDQLTDAVDTTGSAFLGLTLGCARCHDHKYDPVTQRDYFGLQAIFSASDQFDEKNHVRDPKGRAALNHTLPQFELEQLKQRARRETNEELRKGYLRQLGEHALKQDKGLQDRAKDLEAFTIDQGALWLTREPSEIPQRRLGLRDSIPVTRLLKRGELEHPSDTIAPAFPVALAQGHTLENQPPSRWRTALAQWIASEQNPLTARVLVNRVWQGHFGEGLVRTPNDFGLRGDRPSHPELLDWLAVDFMESGWSLKHLHRQILRSRTYQMSALTDPETLLRDPENRLLTRYQPRRLQAEVVWDCLRAAAGTLSLEMHGLPVAPPLDEQEQIGNFHKWPASTTLEASRRAVYVLIRRSFRFPLLGAFDLPDNITSCGRRDVTTVPNQALTLLNNRTIQEAAAAFARRLWREADGDAGKCLERAWRYAYGRAITEAELQRGLEFLQSRSGAEDGESQASPNAALAAICLALFNTNEFIYVE